MTATSALPTAFTVTFETPSPLNGDAYPTEGVTFDAADALLGLDAEARRDLLEDLAAAGGEVVDTDHLVLYACTRLGLVQSWDGPFSLCHAWRGTPDQGRAVEALEEWFADHPPQEPPSARVTTGEVTLRAVVTARDSDAVVEADHPALVEALRRQRDLADHPEARATVSANGRDAPTLEVRSSRISLDYLLQPLARDALDARGVAVTVERAGGVDVSGFRLSPAGHVQVAPARMAVAFDDGDAFLLSWQGGSMVQGWGEAEDHRPA